MDIKFRMKVVSSQESCFLDESIDEKMERASYLMYRNERLAFQVAFVCDRWESRCPPYLTLGVEGALAKYVRVREVVSVPNHYPVCPENVDDNYLRTEPGLYPNLLRPLKYRGHAGVKSGFLRTTEKQLRAFFIDVKIPDGAEIDFCESELLFTLKTALGGKLVDVASASAKIRVSKFALPAQRLIHTEWFYCDTIAEAYRTKAFSPLHWKMIEKYMRVAVDNGINMIMMPLFTQELDTYIGGERMTTQLVGITVGDDGEYSFDFALVDKWIDLCERVGVKYFEIPHFFTQWGAEHAPKIVAKVKGRQKRIFGWETDSMGEEYRVFLSKFIPAIVNHFKKRGIDKRCYYHISDEPSVKNIEKYLACKERVAPYLEGYNIIDALSSFEFYKMGILKKPIPSITHAREFLDAEIPGLWVYYCGANGKTLTTDRYLSMPIARTRILGVQLYRNNIEGFLHWGFNFYHNCCSYDYVDPLSCSDGEYFAPGGDMCVVYPGPDGEVYESMRLNALREAVDDIRALELCESVLGRDRTDQLISDGLDEPLTFYEYPREGEYLLNLRDKIILALESAEEK